LGVVKKHDFRAIQRKIPQKSDFAKKVGFEPSTPWGNSGVHCENVGIKCLAKIGFCDEKHDFC
jgi:hypothetical protein